MGRRKFRLADMMPNYWFHKLRDMRRARTHRSGGGRGATLTSPPPPPRGPRASPKPAPATPRQVSVALPRRPSYNCTTRDRLRPASPPRQPTATEERQLHPLPPSLQRSSRWCHRVGRALEPVGEAPGAAQRRRDMDIGRGDGGEDAREFERPALATPADDAPGGCRVIASDTDIIIDLLVEDTAERVLRPIVTRPPTREVDRDELKERKIGRCELSNHAGMTPRASAATEQGDTGNTRRSSASTGRRLKTRTNSPRVGSGRSRKGKPTTTTPAPPSPRKKTPAPPPLAESFAVVKASADPRKDFRESMEEMIAEKRIRDATGLEDLLACYLALNAAEYHGIIVEVFEQIWTGLAAAASKP